MTSLLLPDWLLPFLGGATALAALLGASLAAASGRDAGQGPRRRTWAALVPGLGAPLALLALYVALGHPVALDPARRTPDSADAVESMIERLATRLEREGSDVDGWLMLARSLKVTGRHAQAAAAYEKASARALQDPDLLADWIEARILADDHRFDARSRELLAQAMALAPDHPAVLMMRALAALDRGDRAAAGQTLMRLRGLYAPGSADREALDGALRRLDAGEDPRTAPRDAGVPQEIR
jgi:cytochrome c-type biogenesis protein CcmH